MTTAKQKRYLQNGRAVDHINKTSMSSTASMTADVCKNDTKSVNASHGMRVDTNPADRANLSAGAGLGRERASDCKGMTPCLVQPPGEGFRRRSFSTFHPFGQPTASANESARLRWSADFSGGGASRAAVVVVRKSKVRPEPPLRSVSLPLRSRSSACSPSKRHSCPLIPPVTTSVIPGPSPLGCRMRPRTSPRLPPVSRLSLQIPLSVSDPDAPTGPAALVARGCPPGPNAAPPPRPGKPVRRHSDSSSFLRPSAGGAPLHPVTLEELGAVRLRPVDPVPAGSDDVFAPEGAREDRREGQDLGTAPPQSAKVPPLVPAKSAYSKWLAHQMGQYLSLADPTRTPGAAQPELSAGGRGIYTRVQKKKKSEAGSSAGPEAPSSALPGYQSGEADARGHASTNGEHKPRVEP